MMHINGIGLETREARRVWKEVSNGSRELFSRAHASRCIFASSSSGCKLCLVSPFIRAEERREGGWALSRLLNRCTGKCTVCGCVYGSKFKDWM